MSLYELLKNKSDKLENQIIVNIKFFLKYIKGHKVDLTYSGIRRTIIATWKESVVNSVAIEEDNLVLCLTSVEDNEDIKGPMDYLYLEELLRVLKVVEEEYRNQN